MYHIIWSDHDHRGKIESFNCSANFSIRLDVLLTKQEEDDYGTVIHGVLEGEYMNYTVSKSIKVEADIWWK